MDGKKTPAGTFIRALGGYEAFIPNPLPPHINWDSKLISVLSRADHLLGMLSREGGRLPNPHLLMRPFITREAVLSSKIEGTQATVGEILAHDAGIDVSANPNDLREINNYITALDRGLERLKDIPLSLRLIKELHQTLMQGVRGDHVRAGEFRTVQNWIGLPGCTVQTATYIPPTPGELNQCLKELEAFLHDTTLPPLIHIALCHYQFEAIHPFIDGNGRVGRLLISLLLIEKKMLPAPLLYLSAFFEATRSEYYRQLLAVSTNGSWEDWLAYFLNGVALQSADVLSRAERINTLITYWQLQVATRNAQVAQEIIKELAVNPYCTTSRVSEKLGVAYTTAQRALEKLQGLGIIKETSQAKRGRVYCATEILAILEEPTSLIHISE